MCSAFCTNHCKSLRREDKCFFPYKQENLMLARLLLLNNRFFSRQLSLLTAVEPGGTFFLQEYDDDRLEKLMRWLVPGREVDY